MPNLQTLPVELVLEILLYVFVNIRGRPDKQLEILSRVCKSWTPYAQRLLFRNVRLLHPDAAYGFLRATNPRDKHEHKHRLGDSVRTLEMTIISDKMVNVLPFVLRHCPKLHEFSIKLQANKGLNIVLHPLSTPPELHFLSTVPYGDIPLPQIQALRINSDNNKSLYKIIRSWPDIKHLVVTGEALVEFCLTPRNSNAEEVFNKLHLYEFQTGRVTMRSGKPTAATLRASLNSSIGTLQILDLKGISDGIIGRSGPLFVEHGPHLRSLRLPYISPEIGRDLVFLRHCVSLEEIVVYAYPTKTLWDKLVVGTIRHASFGAFTEPKSSMQAALRWLRTFPSLRVLSWPMGVGSSFPKDDIAKVERFCKEKGVYFRVLSMLEIEEELIEPTSFPRDELTIALWR